MLKQNKTSKSLINPGMPFKKPHRQGISDFKIALKQNPKPGKNTLSGSYKCLEIIGDFPLF
jgi:hypothetical protein